MNRGNVIYDISVLKNDISDVVSWLHNIRLIKVLIEVKNKEKNISLNIGEFSLLRSFLYSNVYLRMFHSCISGFKRIFDSSLNLA